jgi:hypothetical protein
MAAQMTQTFIITSALKQTGYTFFVGLHGDKTY